MEPEFIYIYILYYIHVWMFEPEAGFKIHSANTLKHAACSCLLYGIESASWPQGLTKASEVGEVVKKRHDVTDMTPKAYWEIANRRLTPRIFGSFSKAFQVMDRRCLIFKWLYASCVLFMYTEGSTLSSVLLIKHVMYASRY